MSRSPGDPRKLEKEDDCSDFSSGAAELDDWFRRFAFENLRANNAITYVTCVDQNVVGFYSIAVAGVAKGDAPVQVAQRGVPSDIPCILLARLAVDKRYQGQGLGLGLLQDALMRAATISESVGARAVLIHARDEKARAFYESSIDCFRSPAAELQLMIPMKAVRHAFLVR
ncbi:GNAT family N-acetyltransferase [Pseudarthrobacter sulfonivorans]|uniref:GNAT family N-acetyltransferase n=1 Tax=Pseudarthrobacter sulfonivorans TaxID=121292 RepID=UPI002103FD1B|nr:GNAT family N-acetyltransferase [Pseudarthrobacter sulfonivorans]